MFSPGDRVIKRGLGHKGEVRYQKGDWVRVDWDQGVKAFERPARCSVREICLDKGA